MVARNQRGFSFNVSTAIGGHRPLTLLANINVIDITWYITLMLIRRET